jgi:hypothetical protein
LVEVLYNKPASVIPKIHPPYNQRLTQPVKEVSTRNLTGGKGYTLPPSLRRLSRNCGSFDVSETCGLPLPITGIAFTFFIKLQQNYILPTGTEEIMDSLALLVSKIHESVITGACQWCFKQRNTVFLSMLTI